MTIIKDKESLKKFGVDLYKSQSPESLQQRIRPQGPNWYIFGIHDTKGPTVLGPESTEAEVIRIGDEQNLVGPQDDAPYTYVLDTIDINAATRVIKADLLKRGIDMNEVMRRFNHQ